MEINGKAVIGEQKDIQEVKNAYKAYEEIDNVNSIMNLYLYIHFQMEMDELRDYGKQQYLHIGKSCLSIFQ